MIRTQSEFWLDGWKLYTSLSFVLALAFLSNFHDWAKVAAPVALFLWLVAGLRRA